MDLTTIPAFFSPSTVLLVDDNHRFLKHMSLQLADPLNGKLFNDAEEALKYVAGLRSLEAVPKAHPYMVANVESSTCVGDYYSVNCDLSAIPQMIYNNDRFKRVSVAVVDYAMPKMNGLAFCRRLQHTTIKKIMLTGEADHQVAVEAFNEGLIDQFILKSTQNLNQKLNDSILAMQQQYFIDLSKNITHALLSEPSYSLSDPKVAALFKEICKQHDIVEYYLLDTSGTVLLLDLFGHPSWFVARSRPELKMYADLAEEEGLSKTLCKALKTGQQVPFFPTMEIERYQWTSYLHPATPLEGDKETYYHAFLKESDIGKTNLDLEDTLSYIDYLQQQALSEKAMA